MQDVIAYFSRFDATPEQKKKALIAALARLYVDELEAEAAQINKDESRDDYDSTDLFEATCDDGKMLWEDVITEAVGEEIQLRAERAGDGIIKETGEACPGCGKLPGEGLTETCFHPNGCGFWRANGDVVA